MTLARIARVEGRLALLLPQTLLDELGAGVGDEFDVALENQAIVARHRKDIEQIPRIDAILDDLFREREAVYRALAEGAK